MKSQRLRLHCLISVCFKVLNREYLEKHKLTTSISATKPYAQRACTHPAHMTFKPPRSVSLPVAKQPTMRLQKLKQVYPANATLLNRLAPSHTSSHSPLSHATQDCQLTTDGVVVVLHDEQLGRTTPGAQGPVAGATWAHLGNLDVGSWYNASFSGARIPQLTEVLRRYRGRVHLHLVSRCILGVLSGHENHPLYTRLLAFIQYPCLYIKKRNSQRGSSNFRSLRLPLK